MDKKCCGLETEWQVSNLHLPNLRSAVLSRLNYNRVWFRFWSDNPQRAAHRKSVCVENPQVRRRREYAGKEQCERHLLARDATVQLLMRQAARAEATRQYLAAKAAAK